MKTVMAVVWGMVALGTCQVATLSPSGEEGDSRVSALFTPGALTVMTRGLSPGLDLARVLEEPGAGQAERAAEVLESLLARDTPARLQLLADDIQYARPHLIGLQQVVQVRRQSPGDSLFGGTRPAQTLTLDPLAVLLGELESRGLHYREVARVANADVEVPLLAPGERSLVDDLRMTDSDIILARGDVAVTGARMGNYLAHREVTAAGQAPRVLLRGWVSVAAAVEGRTYRFVNTHLDSAPDEQGLRVQRAQAAELIGSLRSEPLPVVLVGDFHTPADLGLLGAPTYGELLLAGYVDVWTRRQGMGAASAVPLALVAKQERHHLVLVRNPQTPSPRQVGPVLAYALDSAWAEWRFGPWREERTGVVARLRMPTPARN